MGKKRSFFKQHLPALFEKIELGKPVHFKRLLLGLAECGVSPNEVEKVFNKKALGKKRYRVSIKPESFQEYQSFRSLVAQPIQSARVLAATQGKSHSKSTSGTFCLIHTSEHRENPYSIMIDNGLPRSVPSLKKKLLLIENFELFLRYETIIQFLKDKCGEQIDLKEWDVVFSQGSGILNKQFLPFLMNYQKVHCLFDLDFGGLITFTTLKERLNTEIRFVYPTDVEDWVDKYGFEMPPLEWKQLKNLSVKGMNQKKTKRIMDVLLRSGRKVEQEVYLI